MKSIIYILKYYHINHSWDRNDNQDYFLDLCRLNNHHLMVFNVKGNIVAKHNDITNLYIYLNKALNCMYRRQSCIKSYNKKL